VYKWHRGLVPKSRRFDDDNAVHRHQHPARPAINRIDEIFSVPRAREREREGGGREGGRARGRRRNDITLHCETRHCAKDKRDRAEVEQESNDRFETAFIQFPVHRSIVVRGRSRRERAKRNIDSCSLANQ